MKRGLPAMILIAVLSLFMGTNESFAQAIDSVKVYANPPGPGSTAPTIEKFISGDTTATGQRNNPNRVYVLQQTGALDTVYYYYDPIYLKSSITIVGKVNPVTGKPPVIQPFIRADNSAPSNFINSSFRGAVITFKNLYFLGSRYDGIQATANLININSDSTTVRMDHCVLDNANGTAANFNGSANWNKFFLTNSEFRNVSNQFWQSGVAVWANNGVPMDTVLIRNNTFFGMGRAIYGGPGYFRYLLLDHNTCFLGTSGLLLASRQSNATITNNIFYSVIAHGADSTYIKGGSANGFKEGFGIVMMDSLATVGTSYGITEQQRNVVVKNNAYYWNQSLVDMWKAVNDTAKGWRVVPPVWMNAGTDRMFNDHTNWPGFQAANNNSIDPVFPSTIVRPAVDSLVKFIRLIGWTTPYGGIGNAGTFRWWQLSTNPDPASVFAQMPATWKTWSNGYPVPENLRYSNTALQSGGTDGKPLGDLNWFPEYITAVRHSGAGALTTFSLGNNYPNPFNPSTAINIRLDASGPMSLKIYNVLGQLVSVVDEGYKSAGSYTYTVAMDKFVSGVYFYTLRQGSNVVTKKMTLMK
jgi:hypothetical protein